MVGCSPLAINNAGRRWRSGKHIASGVGDVLRPKEALMLASIHAQVRAMLDQNMIGPSAIEFLRREEHVAQA